MTEDQLKEYWDRGWNDYWNGVNQNNCPTWPDQEKRDQWMMGWLTAQSTEFIPKESFDGDLTTPR